MIKVSFYLPNQILARIVRRYFPKRKSEFVADQEPYIFKPEALTVNGDCYFDGYWMSPLYFNSYREAILKEFEFKPFDTKENLEYEKLLKKDNSITIHIRRGDYVGSNTLGGICTIRYYRNAIRQAREHISNPVFFIFSNDQEWCMENLKDEFGDAEVYFANNNKGTESYRDMQLMSLARCTILANSSFSWWGAYLNQRNDHITFCPNKWHNQMEHKDHYVDGWIKVEIL